MKQNLKRKIAIALLLAAGLSSLCGCGRKTALASGEIENSPYPCTWAEQKNGSFVIEITGELPQNPEWRVMADSGTIEALQNEGSASFTVKPLREGRGMLLLRLRDMDFPVEKGADFSFNFSVDEKNRMTLNLGKATAVDAEAATTDAGTGVYWKEGNNGSLFVYLEGEEWSLLEAVGMDVLGPTADNGISRLELVPLKDASVTEIKLENSADGEIFAIAFEISEGSLVIKSIGTVTPEEPEEQERELTEDQQYWIDAINNAETDEEKEALLAQADAAFKQAENEVKLKEFLEEWTAYMGREPTDKELKMIKESLFGEQ